MKIIVTLRQYAAYVIFAAITVGGGLLNSANAQVQFPIDKPTPKVGDVWKYRTVDLWTGNEQSTLSSEFVGLEADRFIYRFKSSLNNDVRTARETTDLGPCRTMQNSDQFICVGPFRFPMQLGQKTEFEKLPYPDGAGHNSAKCEVKAEEKVTVAAGTFDAVRVECAGFWNRVFDGFRSGRFTQALWYSPKANRNVKSQYFDFDVSGRPFNKTQTELVEFIPSKN
jgi:hypothetical protein